MVRHFGGSLAAHCIEAKECCTDVCGSTRLGPPVLNVGVISALSVHTHNSSQTQLVTIFKGVWAATALSTLGGNVLPVHK